MKKPFLKIVLAVFFALTVFLLREFITLILSCIVISFIIKPFYNWINKLFRNKHISAIISLILAFSVAAGILVFIINSIYYQVTNYGSPLILQFIDIDSYVNELNSSNLLIDLNNDVTMQAFDLIYKKANEYVFKSPLILIDILMLFYITFFLIIDSDKIYQKLLSLLPDNSKAPINSVFSKISNLLKDLSFGYFLVSLFVMLFSFIFLSFIKMPLAFDYSLLSAVFSLIPLIGNWIIPIFLSFYYAYSESYLNMFLMIIFALILGQFIKMIRIIVNKNKTIHPILFIIGVIVGFYSFGLMGFLIGPLLFGVLQIGFGEIFSRQKNI
jgi:predicted PurR-regulated permease PerM